LLFARPLVLGAARVIFTTNQLFVKHPIGGVQVLIEANANNAPNWLPQVYTNMLFANNTMIGGMGSVATNANAGIAGLMSLPNRYAPGNSLSVEPGTDRGFVVIDDMVIDKN
jgi:hypothetical protein